MFALAEIQKLNGAAEPTRRDFSALVAHGDEITPEAFAAFLRSMERVIRFLHFSGQRYKDVRRLSRNGPSTVCQRWYVYVAIMDHWVLDGNTRCVELAKLLGVSKSLVMRAMKDWNVEFGIYGAHQKKVSAHADHLGNGAGGTYVEAGRRGHETRRKRAAEKLAASKPPDAVRVTVNGGTSSLHKFMGRSRTQRAVAIGAP